MANNNESKPVRPLEVQPLKLDEEDREIIARLNKIVTEAFESMAQLTRLPVHEVLHIVEEVDVAKLKDATQDVIKKIAHCTDLDRSHIIEIFQSDPSASIDDIVIRLHARSRTNRSRW